jgi:hypothetical protein
MMEVILNLWKASVPWKDEALCQCIKDHLPLAEDVGQIVCDYSASYVDIAWAPIMYSEFIKDGLFLDAGFLFLQGKNVLWWQTRAGNEACWGPSHVLRGSLSAVCEKEKPRTQEEIVFRHCVLATIEAIKKKGFDVPVTPDMFLRTTFLHSNRTV